MSGLAGGLGTGVRVIADPSHPVRAGSSPGCPADIREVRGGTHLLGKRRVRDDQSVPGRHQPCAVGHDEGGRSDKEIADRLARPRGQDAHVFRVGTSRNVPDVHLPLVAIPPAAGPGHGRPTVPPARSPGCSRASTSRQASPYRCLASSSESVQVAQVRRPHERRMSRNSARLAPLVTSSRILCMVAGCCTWTPAGSADGATGGAAGSSSTDLTSWTGCAVKCQIP